MNINITYMKIHENQKKLNDNHLEIIEKHIKSMTNITKT